MVAAVDHYLDDIIIDAVCKAQADETPVELARGLSYDRRLKKALGVSIAHKSEVCASVNRLLKAGMLRTEETGRMLPMMCGERVIQYPILRFLPA